MDDLIVEFLTETNESLDELDNDLVHLEQNPNDQDLLSKIFRLMHTIKGTCGFLDLPKLEKVAHHAENVLGRFRDGDLEVTPSYVTLIFESIDRIKHIVSEIENNGAEPDGDNMDLIEKLDIVFEGREVENATSDPGDNAGTAVDHTEEVNAGDDSATDKSDHDDKAAEEDAALLAAFGEPVPASQTGQNAEFVEAQSSAPPATAASAPEPPKQDEKQKTAPSAKPVSAQTLRVNVDVLENLMTMVSELVLTRNQLLQIMRAQNESDFSTPLQRLNHVVSDLQEGVMQTRMQPIGNAWAKLPRIIRDLSIELDKKIELEMIGQDTELDRQVLDLIKDPLTHMVRNSGDHGIEDPATRMTIGKPEVGKILLKAYHEGGHIIIKISDDGKGLAIDKIKKKIIENKLASEDELAGMSDKQIQQFIFKAGFSTAEQVTAVSGRGVGMDVVRTNIEKIGGFIELDSEEGKGSTFTIKIPLTLAIVSALIVESAGERFAIPQLAVRELVMTSGSSDAKIEHIKGSPVFRLRDHLLPLVPLSDLLNITKPAQDEADNTDGVEGTEKKHNGSDKAHRKNQYIVVAQVGSYSFGIIVDKVFDTEEIVVKPVAKILRNIDLFAGNTILGDGSVIMILDPNGIAQHSGDIEKDTSASNDDTNALASYASEKTSLLLFRAGDASPKAVPLALVARLENIAVSNIEHSGNKMLIQYRDTLMPLMKFNTLVNLDDAKDKPTLVFNDKDSSMGLIVDEIIDITEEHINIQVEAQGQGILGSAIINNKATDVVDVTHFLQAMNPDWFKDHDDSPFDQSVEERSQTRRILLVDDSPFFRNMLTPLLSVAGYEVTTMESPYEALALCEKGASFDIIVSDIEMPDMNGFEFAEKVKTETRWQNTPMVALTSHATPQDMSRGKDVGFEKYIAKFDRDNLLNTISETLIESQEKAV